MKTTTTRAELNTGLTRIQNVCGANSASPHAGILIIVADPMSGIGLRRRTIDFEIATEIMGESEEEFTAAVDFQKMHALCARLPVEEVELTIMPSHIQVKCGKLSSRINRWLNTELPRELPPVESVEVIEFERKELFTAIRVIEPAILPTPTRPNLYGACLIVMNGWLSLIATDGRRLHIVAFCKSDKPVNINANDGDDGIIIAPDLLQVIKRAFQDDPGPIFIQLDETRMKVSSMLTSVTSPQSAQVFIKVDSFILKCVPEAIHVDKEHIVGVMNRVSAMENENAKLTFDITAKEIIVRSDDERGSSAAESLEAETEISPQEILVNRKYLTQLIAVSESDKVNIEWHEDRKIIVVRDGTNYGILMTYVNG